VKYAIVFVILVIPAFSNDLSYNRGELLYFSKGCSSCHGPSAEGSSTYPKLANKKEKFLIEKLQNYKAGKASSVSQQMMAQFAQKLSKKNISDLVHYLSQHKKVQVEEIRSDLLGVDY
jgi:cytochrome c553